MIKSISFRYIYEYFNYLSVNSFTVSDIKLLLYENGKYYTSEYSTQDELTAFFNSNFLVYNPLETDGLYFINNYVCDINVHNNDISYWVYDVTKSAKIISRYDYDVYLNSEIQNLITKYTGFIDDSISKYVTYYTDLYDILKGIDLVTGGVQSLDYYDKLIRNNRYNIYR
jgi:hypothetical protein